jgi:phosphomannomutase
MLPDYVIRKFRYSAEGLDSAAVTARAAEHFAAERIDTEDGVRIDFAEGWVHLRSSNTEPIIRIIAEARDGDAAVRLAQTVASGVFPGTAHPL